MNKLSVAKSTLTRTIGRGSLITKKYSPEILMVIGIAGIVTSAVLACRATLKVDEVLVKTQEKITKIKKAEETLAKDTYSEKDYNKDMTIAYVQTGFDFIKLYGPSVTIGIASIACILGAHKIMSKRNVALIAAYKAVEQGFNEYRKHVVEEYGEDKDKQFKYGIHQETVTEIEKDENGKAKKVKKIDESTDPNGHSQYARFFDEASTQWSKTPEYNLIFLKCQQNYANDLLLSRGHLFLNEVYDMIGIPRSQAGSIVGWVISKEGDNFVDFGIYELNSEKARDFVNGYERSILLDFNVDGVIYNLI